MSVENYLHDILEELRIGPRGETWPATLTVPSTAVLTIDFDDGTFKAPVLGNTVNQNINVPQVPLFALYITNDGPNLVQYSTNKPITSKESDAPIRVGETVPLNFNKPVILRLHLLAIGGQSTVRVVGLI